ALRNLRWQSTEARVPGLPISILAKVARLGLDLARVGCSFIPARGLQNRKIGGWSGDPSSAPRRSGGPGRPTVFVLNGGSLEQHPGLAVARRQRLPLPGDLT